MTSVLDALGDSQPLALHSALVQGLDVLSGNQTVEFIPYCRTVMPLDGYVFWVNANLLSDAQLALHGLSAPLNMTVPGSLHYESTGSQADDESIVIRRVRFTSQEMVTAFAEVAPTVLYLGEWKVGNDAFKFSFSSRGSYYQQADLHHYVGDAIYPVFERQLIDDLAQFDQRQIVSNSLPIWLAMFNGAFPFPMPITGVLPAYPSFLVPDNLRPPYVAVDINPGSLRAHQSIPYRGRNSSHFQLVTERVTLTFYGLNNDEVMNVFDYIIDRSISGSFGIANCPVITDEKRQQVELSALAQKKTLTIDVNYYQSSMRDVARAMIDNAFIGTVYLSDDPIWRVPPPIVETRP